MEFIDFEKSNLTLAEDQQDIYQKLPVNLNPEDPEKPMCFCVQLSPVDMGRLKQNDGKLYLNQLTFGKPFQPIAIDFDPPATLSDLSKEEVIALLVKQKIEEKAALSSLPVSLKLVGVGDDKKWIPFLPSGENIPCISKGSMRLIIDPNEFAGGNGVVRLNLELLMNAKSLEGLNLARYFPGEIEEKI